MSYKTFIVRGISYGQDKLSAFALILEDEKSYIILPVVIGSGEAQSISYGMENSVRPTRPLTHDIFSKFIKNVGYHVESIEIHQIVDGVFLSNIILKNDDGETITLEARTSDAVAMALRFSASIHVSEDVISKAGIVLSVGKTEQGEVHINPIKEEGYEFYSVEELKEMLDIAVRKEDFDMAIELDFEIKKRKNMYF